MSISILSRYFTESSVAIAVLDKKRTVVYANKAFCSLFKLNQNDIGLIKANTLLNDKEYISDFDSEFFDNLPLSAAKDRQRIIRCRLRKKDGSEFAGEMIITGVGSYLNIIVIDITAQMNDERIINLYKDNQLQTRIMNSMGTIAGAFAHEFNNIFSAVSGLLQVLDSKLPEKQIFETYYTNIRELLQRGTDVIDDFMNILGSENYLIEKTDPFPAAEEAVKKTEKLFPGYKIQLINNMDRESHVIHNQSALEIILLEILKNSCEASEETEVISVSLNKEKRSVVINIKDRGSGMDKETKHKIFEPYFTTKKFGNSSGMGMSRVYGIISSIKTDIKINSTLGSGTEIIITIPEFSD